MVNANTLLKSVVSNRDVHEPNDSEVSIFADGSCLRNGSETPQAGVGIVILSSCTQSIKLKAAYLGSLNNQKAEILACAIGLESLKTPTKVRIFSDSKYVIDTMIGKNLMKQNREYWQRLVNACLTHKIEWIWGRGHSDIFQETSDRISRAAATAKNNLDKTTLDRMALMLCGIPDSDTVGLIHRGLKTLAADCDGAQLSDGKGFSKFDSELGKRFAAKADLTVSEALFARKILSKYRTQILKFDAELALLV
jgi:ribonuclease HI